MNSDAAYYRLAMRIFADFSGTIAVPAVFAAILGKWLDQKYHTEPRFLALLLILAFVLTALMIRKKARYYSRAYEKLINQK